MRVEATEAVRAGAGRVGAGAPADPGDPFPAPGWYVLARSMEICQRRTAPNTVGGQRTRGGPGAHPSRARPHRLRASNERRVGLEAEECAPTVSKCAGRPCTCCVTAWMSRKRRSNGWFWKMAVEPAAL